MQNGGALGDNALFTHLPLRPQRNVGMPDRRQRTAVIITDHRSYVAQHRKQILMCFAYYVSRC